MTLLVVVAPGSTTTGVSGQLEKNTSYNSSRSYLMDKYIGKQKDRFYCNDSYLFLISNKNN